MKLLDLPIVASYPPRPAVAAGGADPLLGVVGAPATAPAPDVHYLVAFTHGWGALGHCGHPAGEMKTTLSPRIIMVP